jgi:CO/xanthine dehydrogenase Mo-binding subunit
VTLQAQIARTELGVERVAVEPADTRVGSAGSTSASRQSYVTGAAVKGACEATRERLFERVREEFGPYEDLSLDGDKVLSGGRAVVSLVDLIGAEVFEETLEYHHRETHPLDENGQGDAHLQFAFSAHRAVVEVDAELGLVRVAEIATAQDVGKVMNPQALEGQIEGGIAQGLGLALLEEIQVKGGKVQNASFTDYLLPTMLDMPPVRMEILELADPEAPYGLKGVGEPPTISSTPAIVAALRDATGRPLTRIPVKPEQMVGIADRPPAEPPHPGSAGYAEIGRLDERREH